MKDLLELDAVEKLQSLKTKKLNKCSVFWCRWSGSNRHGLLRPQDFKSCASAISPHRHWRHQPDSNWWWGFCRPEPYHLAMVPPFKISLGFNPLSCLLNQANTDKQYPFIHYKTLLLYMKNLKNATLFNNFFYLYWNVFYFLL